MRQNTKDKNKHKSQLTTAILGVLLGLTIIIIGIMNYLELGNEPIDYKLGELAFTFSETNSEYVSENANQIIRITKDGVSAYDITGEVIWTDTLTLSNFVVRQKEPYFAVANLKDRKISVFSDKGKEGDIITEAPVLYFSINKEGDVATIEEVEDGHIVSAYDKNGVRIPGKRISHIESAGFPIAAEVSPDQSMLLISYIDIYNPIVTSKIVSVPLAVEEEKSVDNVTYGIEITDNLVYEIAFLDNDTWVAIGDTGISYYNNEGEVIKEIVDKYLKFTPYVYSGIGKAYLPIMESSIQGQNTLYGQQKLTILDEKGEVVSEKDFEGMITYFYADDKGVMIGQGKSYAGFDTEGDVIFTFTATQDIEAIRYVGRKLVAITKNEVFLLEAIEEES